MADDTNATVYDSRRPGNPNADLGVPDSSAKSSSPPTTDSVKKDTTTTSDTINGTKKTTTTNTTKKVTTSTTTTGNKTAKNATPKKLRATQAEREPLVSSRDDKDRRQKEAALRHKLRSYEMFLALKEGYMPSNEQIGQWSEHFLKSSAILDSRNRKLSASGRTFVKDLRAWVEAVADLGHDKNDDDKIQEFMWFAAHSDVKTKVPDVGSSSTKVKAGADADAKKAIQKLSNLASLIYGSPEFRKLLNDLSVLARDVFADAASNAASSLSKAADKTRPSKEDVENVDKSAAETGEGENLEKKDLPSEGEAKDEGKKAEKKAKNYGEQMKKKGYESRDEVESYLRSKFPKQRRDAMVNRLKTLLRDIQSSPEYSDSAEFLLDLASKYIQRIRDAALEKGENAKEAAEEAVEKSDTNTDFDKAMDKANEILTTFAGGKTLDDVQSAFKDVYRDIENDDDLHDFYDDVVRFLNRAIKDKDYVTSDSADNEAHRLYDRSTELLDTKQEHYRPDVEHLFQEVRDYGDAIKNDKANKRVVQAGEKVWNDLVSTKNGRVQIKQRVLRDVLDVMVPKLIAEIKYIPVPRIEYSDRDVDLILENIVVESDNFLPRKSIFEASQKAEYSNGWSFTSKYEATTKINIRNFSLYIQDASFVFRKKTGIKFSDRGFFDISCGPSQGASAEIILSTQKHSADHEDADEDDVDSFYTVEKVNVTIHEFNYSYNAYHSWAAALLRPIIRPVIKRVLANLLEAKIREGLEDLDKELYAMSERARIATIASGGKGSLESWIRAVTSRPSTARRRKPKKTTDVEITIGEEEIFPDEHGPGAVLPQMKAAEDRVASESNDTWRSSIFDVRK